MAHSIADTPSAGLETTLPSNDIDLELTGVYHGKEDEQWDDAEDVGHGGSDGLLNSPNIESYLGLLRRIRQYEPIGHIRLHTLRKMAMAAISLNRMWEESQAYDASHRGMMGSVENFLANEEFPSHRKLNLEEAHSIVFIEEVYLKPEHRGRGIGLKAVRMALLKVRVPKDTVVLLQAGSMEGNQVSMSEANEKLTAHWKRLGFEPWSPSDDAWLCLSLEDAKYGLEAMLSLYVESTPAAKHRSV